jgi:hypothetical protein
MIEYSMLKKRLLSEHILTNASEQDLRFLRNHFQARIGDYQEMLKLINEKLKQLVKQDLEGHGV